MAITTTTVAANVIQSEVLREALNPLGPKNVYLPFCSMDNIDGEPSLSAEYPKKSDLGPAAAGTEGVDFTSTTTLGYGTTVTVTPTEAAVARADITLRAARRKMPGETMQSFAARIMAGDLTGLLGLLEEEAGRLAPMLQEKAEVDVEAALDDFTDSQGSTGVDIAFADLVDAIADLEGNEPEHENFAWFWDKEITRIIRTLLTSGANQALSAAFGGGQADVGIINFAQDNSRTGHKGSFLGIPVYQMSPSTNPLPNAGADVAGALVAWGSGRPGPNAQNGATVFTEGHAPVVLLDVDPSGRSIEIITVWEYAVAELRDDHGVTLICDAP
jgi:hypothetical protein